MKPLLLSVLLFSSLQSFATALVPEAKCKGIMDEKPITLTTYVNTQKWCSEADRDMKSVITMTHDEEASVFTSVATEVDSEAGTAVTHSSKEENGGSAEISYKIDGVPGTGPGKFTMKDGEESVDVELECMFYEYNLQCE